MCEGLMYLLLPVWQYFGWLREVKPKKDASHNKQKTE